MESKEQRALMKRFYDHTCFEFMRKDEVRAHDHTGFVELWKYNITWLRDVVDETDRMVNDYQNKYRDMMECDNDK